MAKTRSQNDRDLLDDEVVLHGVDVKEPELAIDSAEEPESEESAEDEVDMDEASLDPFGDKWER